jgi:class 3 adenylate cyclase
MEFVNTIAHIVHTGVANYGGAANKNIGDAFLLVWKLPKGIRWVRNHAAGAARGCLKCCPPEVLERESGLLEMLPTSVHPAVL